MCSFVLCVVYSLYVCLSVVCLLFVYIECFVCCHPPTDVNKWILLHYPCIEFTDMGRYAMVQQG